jgi:cell shape-determining protein MreC
MYKSNKFFQLLTETCGYKPVKIKYSEKEEKIQEARKQMLKAKEAYETMLKVYKEEKGDYYKKRMKIQN